MIMSVDKKTAAKKLQDTCEYAKLFGFGEKNMLFIFKMINVVLGNKKAQKYDVSMVSIMMLEYEVKGSGISSGGFIDDLEDMFNHYLEVHKGR